MADPFTIAMIGMGASAASGAVGALGSLQSGKANAQMYQYKQAVSQINAQIAEQNAQYEGAAGEVETMRSGLKSRYQRGAAKAIQGASNLDVNTGSAAKVRESMLDVGVWDQGLTRANAARRAYGHRVKAMEETAQGTIYGASASNAKTAGYYGAASSILGGASSVSDKWMQASRMGIM